MYSKNNKEDDMMLNSNKYSDYDELFDENDNNDVSNYIKSKK
jgi:hypothetical protein